MSHLESTTLSKIERSWQPPLSCSRRTIRLIENDVIKESKMFFPLELTDLDYFRRLLDCINNGIYDLVKAVLLKANHSDSHLESISNTILYEMLQTINVGNDTMRICDAVAVSLNLNNVDRNKLSSNIEAFLNKDRELSKKTETHTLSATGPIVDLFKLGKEIIQLCGGKLESHAGLSSRASLALQEIQHLEDQRMLHANFKEARIAILGWNSNDNSSGNNAGSAVLSEATAVLELKKIEDLLADEKRKSTIILLHRLKSFSNDIFSLTTSFLSSSNPKDYNEIQRLQEISKRLQDIVLEPTAAKILDDANSLSTSSLKIVSDLLREAEKEKFKDIDKAKRLDKLSRDINNKSKELGSMLAEFTFLDDNILTKINQEGTFWITPNMLFVFPNFDGQTIGSLIIKSSSLIVLSELKKIPGFSAVSEIDTNKGLSRLFERSIDSDDEVTEFEGSHSPIRKSGLDLETSRLNSPKSPVSPSNYGSPSNTRRTSVSFTTLNTTQNSTRRASINSRSNSCFNYSRFDLQISQSNESKFELADDIFNQLSVLLTPKALAHTQLINRLIGIIIDIHDISELCDLDDHVERERLLAIASCIEDTIDADLDDADVVCSRGRKRIDLLTELKQKAERLLIALHKDASSARRIETKNYSLAASLDGLIEGISPLLEQLQAVLNRFSFIDTSIDDMKGRLELEGTRFINSDFIFRLPDAYEGQSIASLAIIAGAGSMLRYIRNYWPEFTSLGVNSSFIQGLKATKDLDEVDFSNAVTLRGMGFDPELLLAAGFGAVDIISAGFSASELRNGGIDVTVLKSAGLADTTSKLIGFDIDIQKEILIEFSKNMNYKSWLKHDGWEIVKNTEIAAIPTATLVNVELGLRTIGRGDVSKQYSVISNLSKVSGLKIDSNGCVTKLILPSNNLSGSLPNNIGYVSTLTQIVLNSNKIVGNIPESIGLLVSLEVIYLNDNEITGEIPHSFKALKNLKILCLDRNKLSGLVPQSLASLRKLQRLTLNNNSFSGQLPYRLVELVSLQELFLQNNKFKGPFPEFLGHMPNLKTLHLSNNYFTGTIPDSWINLSNLTTLSIDGNKGAKIDTMTRIKLQRYLNTCRLKFDSSK